MFILILAVGIASAIIQILSSFGKLTNPEKPGIAGITKVGWVFYACTMVLMILPAIQKLEQDSIDSENKRLADIAQDERDKKLKISYDSSLLVMKAKFDTGNLVVTETLGKYGFKLDSTNKVLVSIRDSAKTRVLESTHPVLAVVADAVDPGIKILENLPNDGQKIAVEIKSYDASSSFFDISIQFAAGTSFDDIRAIGKACPVLERNMILAKDNSFISHHRLYGLSQVNFLFIRIYGKYKRFDGRGNYTTDQICCLNLNSKTVTIIKGATRQKIIQEMKKF